MKPYLFGALIRHTDKDNISTMQHQKHQTKHETNMKPLIAMQCQPANKVRDYRAGGGGGQVACEFRVRMAVGKKLFLKRVVVAWMDLNLFPEGRG